MKKIKSLLVFVLLLVGFLCLTKHVAALMPPEFQIDDTRKIVTESNVVFNTLFQNNAQLSMDSVGIVLYQGEEKLGEWTKSFDKDKSKEVKITCDVNKEMNVTLEKGTVYKYTIYAMMTGGAKHVDYGAIKTTGQIPVKFKERTTEPEQNNQYYYSDKNLYYNIVSQNPNKRSEWYAYGRAYELLDGKPKMITTEIYLWHELCYIYMTGLPGSKPMEGAIACWKNHLAVVEKVEGDNITVSEATEDSKFLTRQTDGLSPAYKDSEFLGYIYLMVLTEDGSEPLSDPVGGIITTPDPGNSNNETLVSKKVTWKKVKKASGYQFVYATNKKVKKNKITTTVKKNSITIKKLKKGKTYYYKVRSFKVKNNKKVYGKWSSVKKIKV